MSAPLTREQALFEKLFNREPGIVDDLQVRMITDALAQREREVWEKVIHQLEHNALFHPSLLRHLTTWCHEQARKGQP